MARRRPRATAPGTNRQPADPQEVVTDTDADTDDIPAQEDITTPEADPADVVQETPRVVETDMGIVETKEQPQPVPVPLVKYGHREGIPKGAIFEYGQEVVVPGEDHETYILVTEDVFRVTYPYGARRPSYILLYAKGSHIPKTTVHPVTF
jgi:hypothetical protein